MLNPHDLRSTAPASFSSPRMDSSAPRLGKAAALAWHEPKGWRRCPSLSLGAAWEVFGGNYGDLRMETCGILLLWG